MITDPFVNLIVDRKEHLVIIIWESINLIKELFGDRCFDSDDFEDIQYLPNKKKIIMNTLVNILKNKGM